MRIQTSIWSSKYKSKTKYQNSSPKNVLNSSINIEKEFVRERKCLKDAYVSLNSRNDSIVQSDRLPEYEDLNKSAILDMYNSSQDAELITSTNKESEDYLSLTRDDSSPDLLKQRNPFIKRVSDLTTSPSVLSNGNCRKRGRNLMRIRRTIIDENAIIESKYFSKDNKECDVLESENKEIEVDLKNTKDNTIPDINTNIHHISQEQLERTLSITDIVQNANSVENNDVFLSNQNDCLTNTYRNVPEKSIPNDKIDNISSITHMTDKSYITDNYLVLSSSNMEASDITNYENVNSLQNNLSKWSNTENDQTFSHKLDTFKKQSSANRVNSDVYIM